MMRFARAASAAIDAALVLAVAPSARAQRREGLADYFASYRFVRALIEQAGMTTFLRLYDSDSTENELVTLYGATREELVRRAGI